MSIRVTRDTNTMGSGGTSYLPKKIERRGIIHIGTGKPLFLSAGKLYVLGHRKVDQRQKEDHPRREAAKAFLFVIVVAIG